MHSRLHERFLSLPPCLILSKAMVLFSKKAIRSLVSIPALVAASCLNLCMLDRHSSERARLSRRVIYAALDCFTFFLSPSFLFPSPHHSLSHRSPLTIRTLHVEVFNSIQRSHRTRSGCRLGWFLLVRSCFLSMGAGPWHSRSRPHL